MEEPGRYVEVLDECIGVLEWVQIRNVDMFHHFDKYKKDMA